jgi:hypothetical protein
MNIVYSMFHKTAKTNVKLVGFFNFVELPQNLFRIFFHFLEFGNSQTDVKALQTCFSLLPLTIQNKTRCNPGISNKNLKLTR